MGGAGTLGRRSPQRGLLPLTPAEELQAYEGLRRGDPASFRLVAVRTEPLLHRLVGLSTDDRRVARLAIADTWATRLRALGMFQWRTTLTTWIAAGVVRHGRTLADDARRPSSPTGRTPAPAPGPADWSDLPFGARWEHVLPALTATHAALSLPVREVLHTHHVERWPTQQGCDVLGLTAVRYEQLLGDGHAVLHEVLAHHVGEDSHGAVPPHRIGPMGAVLRLVHGPPTPPPDSPDPLLVATFRVWSSGLDPRLQRVAGQVLSWLPHRSGSHA